MKMKTTIKKMNTVNLNELIAIAKPMLQTLGVGAATIVLRKFGVPSKMIFLLVSAATENM